MAEVLSEFSDKYLSRMVITYEDIQQKYTSTELRTDIIDGDNTKQGNKDTWRHWQDTRTYMEEA